jgi:hypothetical protein
MTAGYDDWAAARTPPLLAFAAALVDDDAVAEAAVTRALARTRVRWQRVSRDDPDLEARRLVVRACASPRRAAVVLRVLEERSDGEIAEVLHCSESDARRHLQRGFADVHQQGVPADQRAGMREEVVARAGSAPTQLLTRPVTPDTTGSPPRRRRGPGLTALAVLALVGGVAFIAHESRTPSGVIRYPKVDVPQAWRYESYAGVQLRVPDTWGWGSSPIRSSFFRGPHHLGSCGTNQAAVLSPADTSSYVSTLTGFVGRPAVTNQRCMSWGSSGTMPSADAVWFDSPFRVGVRSLGSTIAETRAVGDQRITAFSPESSMRRQILGTVEQVDVDGNGCPRQAVLRPTAGPRALKPDSLSVCVYSQDTGVSTLMYSQRLPGAAAKAYGAHLAAAPTTPDSTANSTCATPSGRWVALALTGDAGTRWDVANLGCARIASADAGSAALTVETVRDWAVGGVTAYLSAPRGGDDVLQTYFRAPAS